jgi:hypothetical protein
MPRGPRGAQTYLYMLGDSAAKQRPTTFWSLRRRLPDGDRWVEVRLNDIP